MPMPTSKFGTQTFKKSHRELGLLQAIQCLGRQRTQALEQPESSHGSAPDDLLPPLSESSVKWDNDSICFRGLLLGESS